MLIFTTIIFGLAVIRTIVSFGEEKTYKTKYNFIAQLLLAITMLISYVWFLNQFFSTKPLDFIIL